MGRPKGSKNIKPSNTSKMLETKDGNKEIVLDNSAVIAATKEFENQLSGDIKKLHKLYSKKRGLPIDDLKELAQLMTIRCKIAYQTELESYGNDINNAKKKIIHIKETGTVGGKVLKQRAIDNAISKQNDIIKKKYHISSSLTTLASELRAMLVEIERIESGRDTRDVNIFNILSGKEDPDLTRKLKKELFTPTEDLFDPEDAEWMEDGNNLEDPEK